MHKPRYVIIDYSKVEEDKIADDRTVEEVSKNILRRHIKAFEELAK